MKLDHGRNRTQGGKGPIDLGLYLTDLLITRWNVVIQRSMVIFSYHPKLIHSGLLRQYNSD